MITLHHVPAVFVAPSLVSLSRAQLLLSFLHVLFPPVPSPFRVGLELELQIRLSKVFVFSSP